MKHLIYIPFLLFIIACGSENEEQIIEETGLENTQLLDEFVGQYYLAIINESKGEIAFYEDCWTKEISQLELSEFAGSPGNYFIAIHGHHSSMNIIDTIVSEKNHHISIRAYSEDEEDPTKYHYSIFNRDDGYIQLTEVGGGDYVLVPKEKIDEFSVIPCEEEEQPMSELDYMSEIFRAFFTLHEGGENLAAYIPKNGIEIITPGPGVSPIIENVTSPDQITNTNLFNTPVYERLLEYMQMHNDEERAFLEFTDELPDMCMPKKEALFVKSVSIEDYKQPLKAIAMLTKMNDELGEAYTYVIIHIEFTDRMRITKIDARDCGA